MSSELSLSPTLTSKQDASISSHSGSNIRVERISLEGLSDAVPASFVLVVFRADSSESDIPYVVEKQMAQLVFRRRNIPDDLFNAMKRGALAINRDEHPDVFKVGFVAAFSKTTLLCCDF